MARSLSITIDPDAGDVRHLKSVFGCTTDSELDARLAGVARAAMQEHMDMFLGRGAFTRGADFKEHRLALLVEHGFAGDIPSENQVARMFQITRSAAGTLLRSMLSKYQIHLQSSLTAAVRTALASVTKDDQETLQLMRCRAPAVIDRINDLVEGLGGDHPKVVPAPGLMSAYLIRTSTWEDLKTQQGVP